MVLPIDGGGRDVLWHVYGAILGVAIRVSDVGMSLSGIPVIGGLVGGLVESLSLFLYWAAEVFRDFVFGYHDLVESFRDILYGTGFTSLLDAKFRGWSGLANYPLAWLAMIFDGVMPSIRDFIYAPGSWVRARLIDVFPFAGDFLIDPGFWVLEFLLSLHPSWGDLAINPEDFVIRLISYYLGEWGEFIIDPLGWLQGWLSVLLGLPADFWSNPWGVGVDMILEVLDTERSAFRTRLLQVGERVLRMLWEGV